MIREFQVSKIDELVATGITDRIRTMRRGAAEINILSTNTNQNVKGLSKNLYRVLTS